MRTVFEEYGSFIIEAMMGAVIVVVLGLMLSAMGTMGNQAGSVEVGGQVSEEYMEIPYIESTGTQYINTRHVFSSDNAEIYIDCELTSKSANQTLFGAKRSLSNGMLRTTGSGVAFSCGSSNNIKSYAVEGRISFTAEISSATKCKLMMNGSESNATYSGGLEKASAMPIFAELVNDSPTNFAKMRLYRFQIYQDGGITRDLVPVVRVADKKPGLYDRINNKFYTNAGSGEFKYNAGFML